jgi:hypothetical protein
MESTYRLAQPSWRTKVGHVGRMSVNLIKGMLQQLYITSSDDLVQLYIKF